LLLSIHINWIINVMKEKSRENPLLKVILDATRRFRGGNENVEGLQKIMSATMSAIEGDVPKPVSEAIRRAEARIESLRFTVSNSNQSAEIVKVLSELEEIITRYDP